LFSFPFSPFSFSLLFFPPSSFFGREPGRDPPIRPRPPPSCAGTAPPLCPAGSPVQHARAGPRLQQRLAAPPSSLTNKDRHYSDRSPPPQRGVTAFPPPRPQQPCTTSQLIQQPIDRESR
jgi:hypothetical protein